MLRVCFWWLSGPARWPGDCGAACHRCWCPSWGSHWAFVSVDDVEQQMVALNVAGLGQGSTELQAHGLTCELLHVQNLPFPWKKIKGCLKYILLQPHSLALFLFGLGLFPVFTPPCVRSGNMWCEEVVCVHGQLWKRAIASLFKPKNVWGRGCACVRRASAPLHVQFITVVQFALLFTPGENGCEAGIIMFHTCFALGLISNSILTHKKLSRRKLKTQFTNNMLITLAEKMTTVLNVLSMARLKIKVWF